MSLTFDQIRDLLTEKFSKEKKRLKTYGTKANSFDLANVVARYVQALMSDSRRRELKRIEKQFKGKEWARHTLYAYLEERIQATSDMSTAIKNMAVKNESERPYKRKVEKHHKHKHRRHK